MRTSLEASVLILAVLGLRWALGQRLSPAWRIGLWMLVGAKLLLPAFVPAGFGLGAWMKSEESAAVPVVLRQEFVEEQPQTAALVLSEVAQADGGVARSWSFSPKIALVFVWLAGAAGILLAALVRQRRFEKMLNTRRPATDAHLVTLVARLAQRAALKTAVRIVLMPAGTAPAMVGLRQPTLLLPEDWQARFDENSLRHVVAHELCHVRQGDLAWNWAALAVQAVHWFNPLVWFVVSRFQADRELRCDAGALALLAPTERLDYGHTLLRIQESFFAPPAIAGLAPCVRNHPTLRQRILMIASPTTRQPWLQAALVLTLGGLVCYSFTTSARAQEKEVPPKVRTRDTGTDKTIVPGNGGADGVKKPGDREREGDGAARKPGMTERDGEGGAKKPGARDGEGERKPGARDGEGERKPGMRDGEKPRTGEREGDGARKTGDRDGEGTKKPGMRDGERPRTGERDGEKPRTGERDGERPRTGERDGEKPRSGGERDGERPRAGGEGEREGGGKTREGRAGMSSAGETITLHVTKNGEVVRIGEEEISMNRLRGHLSNFLPEHPGAKIVITADANVPFSAVHNTADAVRDNGNKNVGIKAE
ncbi:MAG: M56 family metallopeptidase [Prosthecobacter sp.]